MAETGIRDLEQQALGPFRQSFTKRYEQWKTMDLLAIALETMPKQVKPEKVTDGLVRLKSEFWERFNDVNERPVQTQNEEHALAVFPLPLSAIMKPSPPKNQLSSALSAPLPPQPQHPTQTDNAARAALSFYNCFLY